MFDNFQLDFLFIVPGDVCSRNINPLNVLKYTFCLHSFKRSEVIRLLAILLYDIVSSLLVLPYVKAKYVFVYFSVCIQCIRNYFTMEFYEEIIAIVL